MKPGWFDEAVELSSLPLSIPGLRGAVLDRSASAGGFHRPREIAASEYRYRRPTLEGLRFVTGNDRKSIPIFKQMLIRGESKKTSDPG